jgi:acetyl/propionyl-CoA carboxylase alpha subunit
MSDTMPADRPVRRLLVANRGEIAVRIIRACRELGIESVAVYSEADAGARHVRLADRALAIGPASPADSYLRADRIIEAARASGAEAIHPGYGFLSEQAPFAEAVESAGMRFVGPTPRTLASLGDKLAARRSAHTLGVPIVPGTFEPISTDPASMPAIEAAAVAIGYPLLVKAAAGGGGRGMRRVDRQADLAIAVAGAAHEARQAFGDGSVYLERYIEGGRHVEVQLLGDEHGNVVALGERDCSTQRRHQKLVEEAPAPGLAPERRREVHELGVRVARAVGLRNAATVEFLLGPDGRFYFLEVNARLQVEHGVTELVTGLDLVHEQIRIAAGAPLSERVIRAAEGVADPTRHALELRVSAEDPSRDFAPVPGVITRWREPGGPGVRVDSGVEEGWHVRGDYDPLLAKVLVVDRDRETAIVRARRAVSEFETGGLQTTLPLHAWLLAHPAFVAGELGTDFIARHWEPAPLREAAARRGAMIVHASLSGAGQVTGAVPSGRVSSGASGPAGPDGRAAWARPEGDWVAAGRRAATARLR